jgi:hypothetical protein
MNSGPQQCRRVARPSFHGAVPAAVALSMALVSRNAAAQLPVPGDAGPVSCSSDADCGNPYLVCSSGVCVVRYQQPCKTNLDCGPAGFTCNLNAGTLCTSSGCTTTTRCDPQENPCAADADCPSGWSCFSPGGGPAQLGDAGSPKRCYPPFSVFNGASGPGASSETDASAGAADAPSGAAKTSGGGCSLTAAGHTSPNDMWFGILGTVIVLKRRRRG